MKIRVEGGSSSRQSGKWGIQSICAVILLLFAMSCHHKKEENFLWLLLLGGARSSAPAPGAVADPAFTPQPGTFSADQQVAIASATAGAAIHYTTDGTVPTAASALYSAPIPVAGDGTTKTIKAVAVSRGIIDSAVVTAGYSINYSQVSTPQFGPVGGTYPSDQAVVITSPTAGAVVHYTIDGKTPTAASAVYSSPITVVGDGTVKTIRAIALKGGMADSTVARADYSIVYNPAATPQFAPVAGTYSADQAVTITSSTPGTAIHYTTDGTTPTAASATYSAPISVAGHGTIATFKAIAVKSGMATSAVGSAAFAINYAQVSTPQFTPAAGTANRNQSVTISCADAGASIFYTTDGTNPATVAGGSTVAYSGPIALNGEQTKEIRAIAAKAAMAPSTIASAIYTINYSVIIPTVATPSITPVAGSYPTGTVITITSSTPGAVIYYTIDGSVPTTSSSTYLGSFTLTGDATVRAIAVKSGLADSIMAERIYTISHAGNVTFYPTPGNYAAAQSVKLTTATAGATIHYTVDGTTPTTLSPQYAGAIPVGTNKTVKAVAVKAGHVDGPVSAATYTIGGSATYSVGGWVSGLYDGILVLQNNGGDDLTLTKNGPFSFPTPLASGAAYAITIAAQPANGQTCRVDTDNSGTATGGVMIAAHLTSIAVVCGPVSLPVADSGQTSCYWNNAGTWTADAACAQSYLVGDANYPYGQDAHYVNIPAARSFTGPTQHAIYTTDYTTKDNVTGLVWKTCSEGLSGATCASGAATAMTWIDAGAACNALNAANGSAGYAGSRDWRLPTITELESIPNYGVLTPAIDTAVFPGTVANAYWSSSTCAFDATSARDVGFLDGSVIYGGVKGLVNLDVRCVTAGP